jgi:dihydroorotate dehydrogenase (NAD+) catalytic subunit
VETASGMLNAIGLENVGIDAFVKEKTPFLKTLDTRIFVNIYAKTFPDFAHLATRLDELDCIDGIEVNISCPNVKAGGMAFGVDPQSVFQVVSLVKKHTRKLVVVKLSPNVTDIVAIAKSAEDAGADALSLINTLTAMAVDIHSRCPKLANVTGGLSGPAIKPVALKMVWQTAQNVNIPVIGIGGITNAQDALEFIIAGAKAVQVGTANLTNPKATMEIIDGMINFMIKDRIENISELTGSIIVHQNN